MGDKMQNSMTWLRNEKLTPLQLFYIIGAVFWFIFTQTEIYNTIPDIIKTIVFVGIVIGGILLGVSILNTKKLALEMKAIFIDKNMTIEEKVNAYGNLALIVLTKFGEAFNVLNKEQGIDTYKEPESEIELETVEAKMD